MAELASTKIYGDLVITGSLFVNGERKDEKWDEAYEHSQFDHSIYATQTYADNAGLIIA